MSERSLGILFACITALFWGFLAIALKLALKEIDSITIVWFRFAFAAFVLLGYFGIKEKGRIKILKALPPLAIVSGIMLALNYLGYMKGVEYTNPSTAQIIIQFGPLSLAIAGIVHFKESINKIQVLGFFIAATGFVLFYEDQLRAMISNTQFNLGVIWVLFAAITWMLYAVFQKKLPKTYSPQEINLIIYLVGALGFSFSADYSVFTSLSPGGWALVIFLGVNTLIAYGCMGEALKRVPANQISIIINVNPLITIFVMTILTRMQVSWIAPQDISLSGYIGALLVVGGAMTVVLFAKKEVKKKPQIAVCKKMA
jgi:drug/metabolite transporter (DMT)-like permease